MKLAKQVMQIFTKSQPIQAHGTWQAATDEMIRSGSASSYAEATRNKTLYSMPLGTAMVSVAMTSAIRLIAGKISQMPLLPMRKVGGFEIVNETSALAAFAEFPSKEQDTEIFWQTIVRDLLLHGKAYALLAWDERLYAEYLPFNCVSYKPTGWGKVEYDISDPKWNRSEKANEREVLDFTYRQIDGYSNIAKHSQLLDLSNKLNEFLYNYFATGGSAGFAIITQDTPTDTQIETMLARLDKQRQDPKQFGTPLLITGASDVKNLMNNLQQMALPEVFKIVNNLVLQVLGVPPFMIGDIAGTSGWGSGVSAINKGFDSDVLAPIYKPLETQLNRKITAQGQFGEANERLRFDKSALTPLAPQEVVELLKAMGGSNANPAIITPNEARMIASMHASGVFGNLASITGADGLPFFDIQNKSKEQREAEANGGGNARQAPPE